MANHTSPFSPAVSSAGIKQPQVPISRPSGAAYERPERARTSHACEPCRERKTKCDGDRPSCRRCLHTGTGCHYGYGKGWRKRKTAEDLTATSRRLARYENLLDGIMPMVPPNVKQMIEEARQEDVAASAAGSETTESSELANVMNNTNYEMSGTNSTTSTGGSSFPFPHTASLSSQTSQGSLPRAYDPLSPISGSNPLPRPTSQGGSPDELPLTRLPSIRPDGLLIEPGANITRPRPTFTKTENTVPHDGRKPSNTSPINNLPFSGDMSKSRSASD